MYGGIIGEPVYQFKFNGEIALWRQKWVILTDKIDGVIPQTAAEALAACDKQTFPLIHAFLSILLTLPVASEHSTCRKKLFYASKTQIMDEDKDE